MINPPSEGDESYQQYIEETTALHNSMKERSDLMYQYLSSIHQLEKPKGSMYMFPSIPMSQKFIDKCKKENVLPDEAYCMEILNKTGMCWVPGSGFSMKDHHFYRTTFLPPIETLEEIMPKIINAHNQIIN